MALVDIPHVIDVSQEMAFLPNSAIEIVTIVITDLELDLQHPHHDKTAVDKLLSDLSKHVQTNPQHAGKLRLKTKGR